jgi:hypothetical protein
MARCAALKPDGNPCERIVGAAQGYCYSHDESRAGERRANASKAAKSKAHTGELSEVKAQLRTLADDVVAGNIDKGRASVAAQVLGVFTRVVEVERKIREQDELLERLGALEQAIQSTGGRRAWGA